MTELRKLIPGDICHGWSPTIPRMVTHQPKDGHLPDGSVLKTWNLALRHNPQNLSQVTTAMYGHLPFLGWPPTNPIMVTHQNIKNPHLNFLGRNSTRGQGTRGRDKGKGIRDKGQGIRPKLSLTLKTKSCFFIIVKVNFPLTNSYILTTYVKPPTPSSPQKSPYYILLSDPQTLLLPGLV